MSQPRFILFALIIAAVALTVCGCSQTPSMIKSVAVPEPQVRKNIRVEVDGTYRRSSLTYPVYGVTGVATNESNRSLRALMIEFGAYDNEGVKIGSALAATPSLGVGGKWRFDAIVTATVNRDYKITEIRLENVNGAYAD